jgi:hypothetical protein
MESTNDQEMILCSLRISIGVYGGSIPCTRRFNGLLGSSTSKDRYRNKAGIGKHDTTEETGNTDKAKDFKRGYRRYAKTRL